MIEITLYCCVYFVAYDGANFCEFPLECHIFCSEKRGIFHKMERQWCTIYICISRAMSLGFVLNHPEQQKKYTFS